MQLLYFINMFIAVIYVVSSCNALYCDLCLDAYVVNFSIGIQLVYFLF